MTDDSIKTFGTTVPLKRAGQPVEIATCFVFLASADSSYIRFVFIPVIVYSPMLNRSFKVVKSSTSTEVSSSIKDSSNRRNVYKSTVEQIHSSL
jgi:hypothetical protein